MRYLIFTFHNLEPRGGWEDFATGYPDGTAWDAITHRAQTEMENRGHHYAHIVDLQNQAIIWIGDRK